MASFYKKVPKEVVVDLPTKTFEGKIHLIDKEDDIAEATAYLNNHKLIGFDTETRPSFKKGERHQVALLQLSTNEKAYLFRLNKIGLPQEIIDILSNKNIIKTGVAIHDDLKALRSHTEFKPEGFIELQTGTSKTKNTFSIPSKYLNEVI